MLRRWFAPALLVALALPLAFADGPKDNFVDNVRPVPPVGTGLPDDVKKELQLGLVELQSLIKSIGAHELLPDVQIYEKAVRWALEYGEVYDRKGSKPGAAVRVALQSGLARAKAMKAGKTPWTTATGLVVRGYRSKIDGSVQPYGLVIPTSYDAKGTKKHRLDFWWHGRGETLSEANFIADRERNPGQFTPPDTIVVHPYGRYCNANKFAGDIDSLEILDHMKKQYRIDENRIAARGFSMGGAACWQYAVHYPTLFAAAAPGAGFSETPEFLKVFQNEAVQPTWYEQKLWHMYNATDYALNIFNIPTIAYSGEIDRQKQAADIMEQAMNKVGLKLRHIIGPKTAHAYEKGAKAQLEKEFDALMAKGKPPEPRPEIRFTTYTLRYNQCAWLTVDGMEKHWQPATVTASKKENHYDIKTTGVTALSVTLPANTELVIDSTQLTTTGPVSSFVKTNRRWQAVDPKENTGLRKQHGLQGPIDDAFMDSFIMVKPTGKPMNAKIGSWTEKEMKHAVEQWRSQYRGDAKVKEDTVVTEDDIRNSNLILWGDPSSNAVLARIADKLPLKEFTDHTVTLCIYPNPLNPKKYVVLNSGFTFREYDYLNNARQVSKLPDYAIIDVNTPPNSRYPGKVVRAGFFGEKWELLPKDGE